MPYIRIWVHLVFSTKNRDRLINKSLKPKLIRHIRENAAEKAIYLDSINCVEEHCHILISLGAGQTISDMARLIKGESSNWINKNKLLKVHFAWQEEYFAVSVGESQIGRIKKYIENQEKHHKKMTFKEEYDQFIEKYGFKILG